MKIIGIIILCFVLSGVKAQSNELLLQNVRVVDIRKGNTGKPTDILIRDGRIVIIGEKAGQDFKGIHKDFQGAYVLPGLINAHVHLGNEPEESDKSRQQTLEYLLQHGITTVRDAAGDARILQKLQEAVRTGKINGPDIYYAAFMAGPPYYMDNDREKDMVTGLDTTFAPWLQCIRPGDDLQKAMKSAKACGATGIKIYGGFSAAELPPLVKAAKQEGLQIWGHATLFPAKPTEVAESGVHVISHAYMLEWENVKDTLSGDFSKNHKLYYPNINHKQLNISRFIDAMKKQDAIFDPTLYICMVNSMEWSAQLVKEIYQSGIRICAGTDYIEDLSRPAPFLFDELELYVKECGFSPLDAIRSATITAAETVGQENEIGSVETGKKANLLVVKNNPLENIENLKEIKAVIKAGKVVRE